MNLDDITPLILTYNEEANLPRTLAALSWARQILIVDSGSVDGTLDIAAANPIVTVIERPFDDFAAQCNFGLEHVETEWALSIDADYVCAQQLADELAALQATADVYTAEFIYSICGRPLRAALYPPRPVLFRTRRFTYVQDGHAHKLDLGSAACGKLCSKIAHDDRKPLSRWLASQAKYAELEADKLLAARSDELGWKDRLRRGILWAPPLTLAYCLLWKRLILDGWSGVYYSLQRSYAELLLSLELLDRKLRRTTESGPIVDLPQQVESDLAARLNGSFALPDAAETLPAGFGSATEGRH